jgi:hypothetical protein
LTARIRILGQRGHRRYLAGVVLAAAGLAEAVLIHLGRTYGSLKQERAAPLPGDEIVARRDVMTNHATTIDASPEEVWPWLTQMGWHKAGWYTARWVDRLLFPANLPSATRLIPELQNITIGSFILDGPPETGCGFTVERLDAGQALVLHSTSHLPSSWRSKYGADLDWSWSFNLTSPGPGRTRLLFRSRWVTSPWWFTLFGWFVIVPGDFLMARDMLIGVKTRAEGQFADTPAWVGSSTDVDIRGIRDAIRRSPGLGRPARDTTKFNVTE